MSPDNYAFMDLKIAQYDDTEMAKLSAGDKTTYLATSGNYAVVPYKEKQTPANSWSIAYVTGHKYRLKFDNGQLNYTQMRIEVNQCWLPADKSALFNLLYTDNYEAIDFFGKYSGVYETENQKAAADSLYYANGTLNTVLANAQVSGMNYVDPVTKEINWVINGRKESSKEIESTSVKCRANEAIWCTGGIVATECTGEQKLWSEPTTWITAAKP